MNFVQAQQTIMDKSNDGSSLFTSSFYILYFASAKDGEIYIYDTKEPHRALKDILNKQPLHEFIHIAAFDTESAMRDQCKWFKLVREARIKLLQKAESFKVQIVNTEPPAAPPALNHTATQL